MSAHTPGPWSRDKYGNVVDQRGESVLFRSMSILCSGDGVAEAEANTTIAAAAPDLLAAMPTVNHPGGLLVKVVAHYADGTTQTINGEVITAAIAKATGEPA